MYFFYIIIIFILINYKLDICICIKDSLFNRCLKRGRRLFKIVMRSIIVFFCLVVGLVFEYKEKNIIIRVYILEKI